MPDTGSYEDISVTLDDHAATVEIRRSAAPFTLIRYQDFSGAVDQPVRAPEEHQRTGGGIQHTQIPHPPDGDGVIAGIVFLHQIAVDKGQRFGKNGRAGHSRPPIQLGELVDTGTGKEFAQRPADSRTGY